MIYMVVVVIMMKVGFDNEHAGKINQRCNGPAGSKCEKVQL